ncbi:MAG: hypothetical protein H6891_05395 [Brucellaceae bacterium]|nr:hypothetical protein [Brucellaceae bacterium]
MSFLARLAARSRFPRRRISVAMPKGMVARRPLPLLRQPEEEQEEETAAPMRRSVVRREEQPQAGRGDAARPGGGRAAGRRRRRTLRRSARFVRRQAERRGGRRSRAAAPRLRPRRNRRKRLRAAAASIRKPEEGEELQTARIIRRAEEVPLEDGEKPLRQPFQSDLEPAAASPHPDLASEEEPPAMQALRREVAAIPPAAPVAETGLFARRALPGPFPANRRPCPRRCRISSPATAATTPSTRRVPTHRMRRAATSGRK